MSKPKRLVEAGATGFERQLLRSWDSEQPSDRARRRALAMGSGAAAALTATSAKASAPVASKAALAGVVGKWLGAGAVVGLATSAASLSYLDTSSGAREPVPVLAGDSTSVARAAAPATAGASTAADKDVPEVKPVRQTTAVSEANSEQPVKPAPPAARPRGTLTEQIALLDGARNALRTGDLGRAQQLVAQYQREHSRGELAQEAELLRIDVLQHQGKRTQAQQAAQQFLRQHPTSTHAERLRSLSSGVTNP